MITEFFIDMWAGLTAGFLTLLPAWEADTSSFSQIAAVMAGFGGMNGFFPVATLGICLGLVMGLKLFMLWYRFAFFVYHQIWGSD